jgi:hypothetical protein
MESYSESVSLFLLVLFKGTHWSRKASVEIEESFLRISLLSSFFADWTEAILKDESSEHFPGPAIPFESIEVPYRRDHGKILKVGMIDAKIDAAQGSNFSGLDFSLPLGVRLAGSCNSTRIQLCGGCVTPPLPNPIQPRLFLFSTPFAEPLHNQQQTCPLQYSRYWPSASLSSQSSLLRRLIQR